MHTGVWLALPCVVAVSTKYQTEVNHLLSGGMQQVRVVLPALALSQLTNESLHRRSPVWSR